MRNSRSNAFAAGLALIPAARPSHILQARAVRYIGMTLTLTMDKKLGPRLMVAAPASRDCQTSRLKPKVRTPQPFMSQSDPNHDPRFLIADSQGPREEQQDAGICLHNDAQGTALLVVCDGVGGKSGGRIASQKVKALASELWEKRQGSLSQPAEDLSNLCRDAHDQINSDGAELGISPRTTIVALYLTATEAHWIHSGDSRLYHFQAGQLVERTEDHTFLELMVQRGAVKEEDMGSHPDQNTLLQSLGGEEYIPPSTGMAAITPADSFLLCTDGFWERTKPEELAALAGAARVGAAALLAQAVTRAVERNGPRGDNVTVALALPAQDKTTVAPVPERVAAKPNLRLLVVAAVLLLVAVLFLFWPDHKKESTLRDAPTSAAPAVPPVGPANH